MTHADLVKHFGNSNRAALALGYSRQALSKWKRKGIPFDAQYTIQMKTKGALKADIAALPRLQAA